MDEGIVKGYATSVFGLDTIVSDSAIDDTLLELIELRTLQMNEGICRLDICWEDVKKLSETERKLYELIMWEKSNFFTAKEKSVLALTDAVLIIQAHHFSDHVDEVVINHFSREEISELLLAITSIITYYGLFKSNVNLS
ncbi:carboxymuconolactone decarboxylase family protein [Pseudogracilibacillus auburnensis]|uniref:Uncharacterized protein n=1 Tax=Pseudogracilibacillus auburnensis TaxID=1494959 RepID=A0A2V3VWL9_9BACI|nr:carboxymuconolactone decarboxylase family protein [Pseudogracilibacillus auburnensis]MBO1002444.1 carboxymuconolactone decarboxylase family protein [Pseudogracilibacillus auburnensis]PXW80929.1 hypothetical protein DFR56_12437 [Pseudogracilibacillus auburnensis]